MTAGVVALVAGLSYEMASRHKALALLREQPLAQNAKAPDQPVQMDNQELQQLRADKMNPSNEVLPALRNNRR